MSSNVFIITVFVQPSGLKQTLFLLHFCTLPCFLFLLPPASYVSLSYLPPSTSPSPSALLVPIHTFTCTCVTERPCEDKVIRQLYMSKEEHLCQKLISLLISDLRLPILQNYVEIIFFKTLKSVVLYHHLSKHSNKSNIKMGRSFF